MKRALLMFSMMLTGIGTWCQSYHFGTDVIVHSDTLDQREPVITTAFNGWLYSAHLVVDSATNNGGVTIRRSVDRGTTWQLVDQYLVNNIRYEDVDIEVAGTDTNSLSLYVAGINHNIGNTYVLYVDKYNATTLSFTNNIFFYDSGSNPIYDLDMATDYAYPAVGASPYSVGLLFSTYSSTYDSILFYSSVDGGVSFGNKQVVAVTGNYFRDVSLSYGRSASASNGRYFGAWELKTSSTARNAHIYTSRSTSNVISPWITPVCLDSLSSTMINLCRHPKIAAQVNNTDNDSSSLSAVVLVDRDYNGDATDYDLLGFYNKRAHYTNFWYRLDVNNSGENDIQPDIVYDIDSGKFRATYYDSTNFRLPYLHNDINLVTPSSWTVDTTRYNDTVPTTSAFPRLSVNRAYGGVSAVWTRRQAGSRGITMFDANYISLFVGINENNELVLDISAYPNPASDYVNVHLVGIENANLQLLNSNGQVVQIHNMVTDNQMISLSELSNGIYFLKFEHNGRSVTKKIIKN